MFTFQVDGSSIKNVSNILHAQSSPELREKLQPSRTKCLVGITTRRSWRIPLCISEVGRSSGEQITLAIGCRLESMIHPLAGGTYGIGHAQVNYEPQDQVAYPCRRVNQWDHGALIMRGESSAQIPAPVVPGVPSSVWARNSIRIEGTAESPKITKDVAEQAANLRFPGFTLRGSVLARVATTFPNFTSSGPMTPPTPVLNGSGGPSPNSVPTPTVTSRLVWIVSLSPSADFKAPSAGPV